MFKESEEIESVFIVVCIYSTETYGTSVSQGYLNNCLIV